MRVRVTASELESISLGDVLAICVAFCLRDRQACQRAAVPWVGRPEQRIAPG